MTLAQWSPENRCITPSRLTNAGTKPVRIARIERSPACHPARIPNAPIAPGATDVVEIACDTLNLPAKLADLVVVWPDEGPELRLELRATIRPLLAPVPALADLETVVGQPTTEVVRLVGEAAASCPSARAGPGAAPGLSARLLSSDNPRAPALELVLAARQVGDWSDRVALSTDVDGAPLLHIPYRARVKGHIQVEPVKPYFDLNDPAGRSQLVSVKSSRLGFRLLGARILSGPFRAAMADAGVRVTVDDDRVPAGQRGVTGKLLLLTNDANEPRLEIQLFALGAAEPPPLQP